MKQTPPKKSTGDSEQLRARRRRRRWVLLALLLVALGYLKYGLPFGPPSGVFTDPAAEKAYFHNGRDGIVLHYTTQNEAYLEAEWEYTGFEDTYKTLKVYRVFKGGWFRPTSRMLLHQYDSTAISPEEVLFYRQRQEVKLHLSKTGFDWTI